MKKRIFILSILVMFFHLPQLIAQRIGISAGFNFPGMMLKNDMGNTYPGNKVIKTGFHIGGIGEYRFTEYVSFEGSLLFSLKGAKYIDEQDDSDYKQVRNLLYIDIPLTVKYTFAIKNWQVYALAGEYFGFGLYGKYTTTRIYPGGDKDIEEHFVNWGSEDDNLRRFDTGMMLGFGIIKGKLQAGFFYEPGLLNISPYTSDETIIKNRNTGITVVWFMDK
jgi:hypothetical protein